VNSTTPCPSCGQVLEAVHNSKGELLGYFCRLVIDNGCDYISVMSTAEHEASKRYVDKLLKSEGS